MPRLHSFAFCCSESFGLRSCFEAATARTMGHWQFCWRLTERSCSPRIKRSSCRSLQVLAGPCDSSRFLCGTSARPAQWREMLQRRSPSWHSGAPSAGGQGHREVGHLQTRDQFNPIQSTVRACLNSVQPTALANMRAAL